MNINEKTLRLEFERQHEGRNLKQHHLRGTYSSPQIAALWNQHVKTAEFMRQYTKGRCGKNEFFVDGLAYYTGQTALTGAKIKRIAGTDNYQVCYDDELDEKSLGDSEAIRLDGETRHFFVVPPATRR